MPHIAERIYNEAHVAYKAKQYTEAIALLEQSLSLLPHYKTWELKGICHLALDAKVQALAALEEAYGMNPAHAKTACLLASLVPTKERAMAILELVLKEHPGYGPALRLKAKLNEPAAT